MNKANQLIVEAMANEMASWTPQKWSSFARDTQAKRIASDGWEINSAAAKLYLVTSKVYRIEAGGHIMSASTTKGRAYVDYAEAMVDYAELAGIPQDELEKRYIKRKPDFFTFRFK